MNRRRFLHGSGLLSLGLISSGLGCGRTRSVPTDEELIALWERESFLYNWVVAYFLERPNIERIDLDGDSVGMFTYDNVGVVQALPPSDARQFLEAMKSARLPDVMQSSIGKNEPVQRIQFANYRAGIGSAGMSKGFVYLVRGELRPVVQSLNEPAQVREALRAANARTLYRHISGPWFLYLHVS